MHKASERGFSTLALRRLRSVRAGRASGRPIASGGLRFCGRRFPADEGGAPELQQVVGSGDQLPLGLAGGEAAAQEAVAAPDDFRVREDRFGDLLAATVERLALGCREHGLDPFCFCALAG